MSCAFHFTSTPFTLPLPVVFFSHAESILDPTCWAIINEDRNTCSLVAREHEVFKLSQGYSVCAVQSVSFENEFQSIVAMSVSYNHRFLALYTNNGIVWMGTSNLQTKYCEFKTNQTEKPKQIEWFVMRWIILFE